MKTHELGMATPYIEDIAAGAKTVEGRLDCGKFRSFEPGDIVRVREDLYEDGVEVGTIPGRLIIGITAIEMFASFREMLETAGYQRAIPRANSLEEALAEYDRYYPPVSVAKFGVRAIYFHLITESLRQVGEPAE